MSGPLASEFEQVRETLALHNSMALSGEQPSRRSVEALVDSLGALARIEEHTHNMEQLLRRVEPELVPNHDAAEELREKLLGGPPSPNAALIGDIRAALSAGEGTPA